MMLHTQDKDLLMLNPGSLQTVYHMDLNRPDIVQEWVRKFSLFS